MKDYYQVLDITFDASPDAIKEQYRFLVQAWHPDKFPNSAQKLKAEEKIKEINEAYETLRNPAKRADYDSHVRFARSSYQQGRREQTSQRQSEDERRRKEETARRAKEEQLRKEKENREHAEAERRRSESLKRQKISQIENEIMLLNKEISNISQDSPNLPSRKIDPLLFIGGMMFLLFGIGSTPINYILVIVGGVSFIFGVSLIYNRVKPNNTASSEVEKRKSRIVQLMREKQNLNNSR